MYLIRKVPYRNFKWIFVDMSLVEFYDRASIPNKSTSDFYCEVSVLRHIL